MVAAGIVNEEPPVGEVEEKGVSQTETDRSPSTAIIDLSSHAQSGDDHTHTDEAESPTHQVSASSMAETPANSMPSETQPTNEYSVPVSTTDQSVPVSDESSVPAVSTSTNELPASVTAGASDRSAQGTNPKTSQVFKPSRPASTTTTSSVRKTVIRTLNSSENQGMRRVVPIFKAGRRGSIPGKQVEKPPGHQSSGPRTTTTTSSNPANRSLRRAERSSATPRRNSLQVDDPKAVTTTGVHGSARDQPQPSTLQRKPSVRKPLRPVVPRPPPEEKMCRSTLRALAAAGGAVPIAEGGGGNSLSAPSTPSHRGGVSNPTPLPGFARKHSRFLFQTDRSRPPGEYPHPF
ncbi:mucin-5AC [Salmo trutta]|uniref:mucin-5AC n=1 Tax=Salmo trutta TaxID=8032 RepID=UPI001130AED9|nr:mucin-5AC-like [Salmo trutta]